LQRSPTITRLPFFTPRLPIEHSTSTLKRPTNTIAMASQIDQLQGGTTMISTGENVQLALLKQAKKRNAIAKEQNAITKERNAIAREQVKATRKQTETFSTLESKIDVHEAILTAMGSKLETGILQPSLPGFVAAATKTPLQPEEPMELIGCTIAHAEYVQLLNYSLKQFVIADLFGLPADIIDHFPSQSRIKFATRLIKAFRNFYNKFQAMARKHSPFPLAFVDILARCVDQRCALIAIDCAKTKSMQLVHSTELVEKIEKQIKRMKHYQDQSLITETSTRWTEYDLKTLRKVIGVPTFTASNNIMIVENITDRS
jgi:hypothetical protein